MLVDDEQREHILRDLVENNPDLVLCIAPDGGLLYANQTVWDVLGYKPPDNGQMHLRDFLADESREVIREQLDRLDRGEVVGPVELTLIDADDKRLSVEAKLNARVEESKPLWYRAVLRDLRDEAPATDIEPPSPQEDQEAAPPRILVVEDDPVSARMLRSMLEKGGYQTDWADTAKAAIEMLDDEYYDAMTLDLVLPDCDGVDLLHQIRANEDTAELPVIVVSASADQARQQLTGDAAHVVDWLNKPFKPNSLRSALGRAVVLDEDRLPRVLHVEDDPEFGDHVRETLSDVAITERAATLAEARRKLQDHEDYDLVLLDLTLPDGLGAELLPFLNRPRGRSVPVILVSSSGATDALASHVADTLVKSHTSQQQLLSTIRAHLRPSS